MTPPSLDLSAKLGPLLRDADMTRNELAGRLHIDASVVYLWFNGSRGVPASRLQDLADALDVTYEDLTGNAPPKMPRRPVLIPSATRPRPPAPRPVVRVTGQSMESYGLGGNPHGGPSPVPGRPRRN